MPYGTAGIGGGGADLAEIGLMPAQHYIGQHYHQPHHHHQHHHHHLHSWYEPQQNQHQAHQAPSHSWYAGVGVNPSLAPGQSGNETLANNYYSY